MKQLRQGKGKKNSKLFLGDGNTYDFENINTPYIYQNPQIIGSRTYYFNNLGTQNQYNNMLSIPKELLLLSQMKISKNNKINIILNCFNIYLK